MSFAGLQLITNLLGNLVLALPGDLKAEDPGSIRNRPDLYTQGLEVAKEKKELQTVEPSLVFFTISQAVLSPLSHSPFT